MSSPTIDQLTNPHFVEDLSDLDLEEIRTRRGQCQAAEEGLSLQRRLIQGRLDIVQAELLRRAGGGDESSTASVVESLPDILIDHGDRHLGPGRLTSLDAPSASFGPEFDQLMVRLDQIVDGVRLSELSGVAEEVVRNIAEELDQLERSVSTQRHQLHRHIDLFQAEIVRRYKSGAASVQGLLGS